MVLLASLNTTLEVSCRALKFTLRDWQSNGNWASSKCSKNVPLNLRDDGVLCQEGEILSGRLQLLLSHLCFIITLTTLLSLRL